MERLLETLSDSVEEAIVSCNSKFESGSLMKSSISSKQIFEFLDDSGSGELGSILGLQDSLAELLVLDRNLDLEPEPKFVSLFLIEGLFLNDNADILDSDAALLFTVLRRLRSEDVSCVAGRDTDIIFAVSSPVFGEFFFDPICDTHSLICDNET